MRKYMQNDKRIFSAVFMRKTFNFVIENKNEKIT